MQSRHSPVNVNAEISLALLDDAINRSWRRMGNDGVVIIIITITISIIIIIIIMFRGLPHFLMV